MMNTPQAEWEPPTHITICDLERVRAGEAGSLDFAMLQCSSEDCLIATHEFDTSPSADLLGQVA